MNAIENFLRGNLSKRTITHYLIPLSIGLFISFLIIARLLFPYIESYPYHWTTSMISRLGWPEVNTTGWIFFSLAFIFLGTFSIPLIAYFYRRFSDLNRTAGAIIRIFMLCFTLSLILLGAIPNFESENNIFKIIHGINAGVLIGGGSLMVLICLILISKTYFTKGQNEFGTSGKLVIPYISIGIWGALCIAMLFISISRIDMSFAHYVHDPSTPLLLSPPMWEWLTMFSLMTMVLLPCFIFPDK